MKLEPRERRQRADYIADNAAALEIGKIYLGWGRGKKGSKGKKKKPVSKPAAAQPPATRAKKAAQSAAKSAVGPRKAKASKTAPRAPTKVVTKTTRKRAPTVVAPPAAKATSKKKPVAAGPAQSKSKKKPVQPPARKPRSRSPPKPAKKLATKTPAKAPAKRAAKRPQTPAKASKAQPAPKRAAPVRPRKSPTISPKPQSRPAKAAPPATAASRRPASQKSLAALLPSVTDIGLATIRRNAESFRHRITKRAPPVIPNPVPTPALTLDTPYEADETVTVLVRTMNGTSFTLACSPHTRLEELKHRILELIMPWTASASRGTLVRLPMLVMNGRALAPDAATLASLRFSPQATVYCFPEPN